ncbi:tyrosine-type recombinase/integrase [Endozoicomonas sp. ALB091]|uniref:tyrosine-type recombinase/integrase n=1 Tax=Endozoicomonas sp. ALB091 TaxID=3403073 RepID=UPI003BB7FCC5
MQYMTTTQLKRFVDARVPGSKAQVSTNLIIRISSSGTATYTTRITLENGKRSERTIGKYEEISLHDARKAVIELKDKKKSGINVSKTKTFSQLYKMVIEAKGEIAESTLLNYNKCFDHAKALHKQDINRISAEAIKKVLDKLKPIPSQANKTLVVIKQVFSLAETLDLISRNPSSKFTIKDAGGTLEEGERFLEVDEIRTVFPYLNKHFTRNVYLASVLLLVFGCRKQELLKTKKSNFDLEQGLWITEAKKKTNGKVVKDKPRRTPLEPEVVEIIRELNAMNRNSEFLFPARRMGTEKPMAHSTLNSALYRLFSNPDVPFEFFKPHDLRRTCATLLEDTLDIDSRTCDKYLGHKPPKVKGTYDKGDRLVQRRAAQRQLLDLIGVYILD